MAATFTVHARLPEEHGTTHCVDVAATDTVKIVLEKVAGELGVDPGDITLYHDGVALHHLEEKVTGTTLGEGSEVEVRQSKNLVAKRALGDMGLECSEDGLDKVVTGEGEDSWKAMVSQMMLDADEGLDVGRAIYEAASLGLLETVKVLLRRADVNGAYRFGLEYLLSHEAGTEDEGIRFMRSTPLHVASLKGHLPVVEHLVSHGADIKKPNSDGMTPLYAASFKGHLPVVEYLVSHGADIDKANRLRWTPLYAASKNGHLPVVEHLVSHGADVGKVNKDGETARQVASCKGHADIEGVLTAAEAAAHGPSSLSEDFLYPKAPRACLIQ